MLHTNTQKNTFNIFIERKKKKEEREPRNQLRWSVTHRSISRYNVRPVAKHPRSSIVLFFFFFTSPIPFSLLCFPCFILNDPSSVSSRGVVDSVSLSHSIVDARMGATKNSSACRAWNFDIAKRVKRRDVDVVATVVFSWPTERLIVPLCASFEIFRHVFHFSMWNSPSMGVDEI